MIFHPYNLIINIKLYRFATGKVYKKEKQYEKTF